MTAILSRPQCVNTGSGNDLVSSGERTDAYSNCDTCKQISMKFKQNQNFAMRLEMTSANVGDY